METIEDRQAISVSETVRVVSYKMAMKSEIRQFWPPSWIFLKEEKGSYDTSFSSKFSCWIQWWNLEVNIFNRFRDIEEFSVKMAEKSQL